MATEAQQTSGPNPLCEIGRNHPRDRHRMRPVVDHPGVWECPRHDLYATIVSEDVAATLDRIFDGKRNIVLFPFSPG